MSILRKSIVGEEEEALIKRSGGGQRERVQKPILQTVLISCLRLKCNCVPRALGYKVPLNVCSKYQRMYLPQRSQL